MDVVRAVNSGNRLSQKAEALADLAQALVGTDPDRAERIADSITDATAKALSGQPRASSGGHLSLASPRRKKPTRNVRLPW